MLMLLFGHHLLEIHSLTLSLYSHSTIQNLISVAENHVYKHCSKVCNDIILMPQFLKVVQQHILGVVGNVIHNEP